MVIVQLTTDNREVFRDYDNVTPWFGTAPQGLLSGFAELGEDKALGTGGSGFPPPFEVHVISCTQQQMRSPEKLASNIWFHSLHVPKSGWMRTGYSGCIRAVRSKLRNIKPDIVHAQGTERDCAMSGVFSGYPNVLTLHGNMAVHAKLPGTRTNFYYKIASLLEKLCLKRTDGVIAISSYTRDLVSPLSKRVDLLPNAVDPTFFCTRRDPVQSCPRVLFVGTFCERKNSFGLLEACISRLKDGLCTLVFAGRPAPGATYYEKLMQAAAGVPNIEFPGFLDRESLLKEFERASILVLPTFEDNCPMVVLEAQAAGLPVAASAVGGIPDLISDMKTGVLFDPWVAGAIGNAVNLLLSDSGLLLEISKAAQEHAHRTYRPYFVAQKHLEIYQDILRVRSNG